MIKSNVGKWGLQEGKGRLIFFICMITLFVCSSAGAFQLPDTGQTKCYQAMPPYAEIPCAGTGQDGAYSINPMSYTDNGNGTVTDNNTGLMWQQQDNGQHYNWYRASGTYHATYNSTSQDVCGELNLGGYSDWRLPSKKDLITLVDYSGQSPTINATYFSNTKGGLYWSSTTHDYNPLYAWYVAFYYGFADYFNRDSDSIFYVRCVRGGQYPEQFLIDNGDGTVTDNATGLMWQQVATGAALWGEAPSYCEGLSLGGHSDWRLPNIKELESLTDDTRYSPAIDWHFFHFQYPELACWSSTTNFYDPGKAWTEHFFIDHIYYGYYKWGVFYAYCVRCVRDGQSELFDNWEVQPFFSHYGYIKVGNSSAPQTFTISNTGTADLHISDISLSDKTNYSLNVNGGSSLCASTTPTISPDSSCTVTVTFSPSSGVQKIANLTIYSDDTYAPTRNVSLIGIGLSECTVVQPNGGEVLASGSTYEIRWNADPDEVKFKLEYSKNNGQTWMPIQDNVTGKSYNWKVPAPPNNKKNCRVKVIGYDSSGVKVGENTSDSTFTIEVLKVTTPDGGETLKSNEVFFIKWDTNATKKPVADTYLYYSLNGGSTWKSLAISTDNLGWYPWQVPKVKSAKTNCKVKVVLKDASGNVVGSDVSEGIFTIQP